MILVDIPDDVLRCADETCICNKIQLTETLCEQSSERDRCEMRKLEYTRK
jgi:hypothetical protein